MKLPCTILAVWDTENVIDRYTVLDTDGDLFGYSYKALAFDQFCGNMLTDPPWRLPSLRAAVRYLDKLPNSKRIRILDLPTEVIHAYKGRIMSTIVEMNTRKIKITLTLEAEVSTRYYTEVLAQFNELTDAFCAEADREVPFDTPELRGAVVKTTAHVETD